MIVDLEQARATDAHRVAAALAGDQSSFGELFTEYFDRTYDVAFRIVRNRDVAAEVAQDTFLAAWTGLGSLEDPGSFGGWVLRISRNRALNRLSRERRSVALGDEVTAAVVDSDAPNPDMEAGLAADESKDLVWAASVALGERDASVLDLHLRHGLSGAALAEELNVTPNNANQILHSMKGRLEGAVRAFVLWRNGNPDCSDLRGMLARQSDPGFGVATARLIRRHLKACGLCEAEQERHLAPAAMFSAVPILVAPLALRSQAAGALMGSGVPMGAAAPPASPSGGVSGSDGASGQQGSPGVEGGQAGHPVGGEAVHGGADTGLDPDRAEGWLAQEPSEPDQSDTNEGAARRKVTAVASGMAVMALLFGGWLVFGGDEVGTPGPALVRPPATSGGGPTSSSSSSTTTSVSATSTPVGLTTVPVPGTVEVRPPTPVSVPDEAPLAPPVPTPDPPVVPPDPGGLGPTTTEQAVEASTTVVEPPEVTKPTDSTLKPRDPRDPKGTGGTAGGSPTDGGPAGPSTGGLLGPF